MNILICIKQVPATQDVEIDPKTGTLIRGKAPSKMNPFDLVALEAGLRLKDKDGSTVTAITMGPPFAKEILYEAMSMGVDQTYLISDVAFAGADVLATAHTLYYAIRTLRSDFDLILCGQQTTDGDTAQVGPCLAQLLGIPHVSFVSAFENRYSTIDFTVSSDESIIQGHIQKPCLLTLQKSFALPRFPSYLTYMELVKKDIPLISLKDFRENDAREHVGSLGSPTQVSRIFTPQKSSLTIELDGSSPSIGKELCAYLVDKHIMEGNTYE